MNNYWKLKAAILARQLSMTQLQAEADKVQAAYAAAMTAEGLDAAKNYTFSDVDESCGSRSTVNDQLLDERDAEKHENS